MHKSNINKKEIKLSLNFNLRFPNQIKQTTIFAIIYNGRKQIKISIGYKINPIFWDNKMQMPKVISEINENEIDKLKEITEKIIELKFAFQNIIYIFAHIILSQMKMILEIC